MVAVTGGPGRVSRDLPPRPRRRVKINLIPVRLANGVVVLHTREEWERFWQGVARDIARDADSRTPLRDEREKAA